MYRNMPLDDFIRELASEKPYPGGGSVSCLGGALGIALALMVGRIVLKRKDEVRLKKILARLEEIQSTALAGIDDDVASYKKVVEAYGLNKENPGRGESISSALRAAYVSQKDFAAVLVEAKRLQEALGEFVGGSISSDLVLSGEFLKAAFRGAYHTAKINVDYFKDKTAQTEAMATLSKLEAEFDSGSAK
ncbi:MAG TPA: cyclodeaminase/cyclohydrolase family protein [Candidatus Omnitrophota bacterium]|nr:cyclodeaminase/cyclohydrolase family protein [Candidatus Omnitrophota bacterium]